MNKDKLRILVVEDDEWHQEQARRQLSQHAPTIVGTYAEASEHLKVDNKTFRKFEEEVLVKRNSSYIRPTAEYDVLLTDLHIPHAKSAIYPVPQHVFTGKPQGLGYALVILGALQNIPYIGMLSDVNHHKNEFVASFDEFRRAERMKISQVGNSRFLLRENKSFGNILEELLREEVKPKGQDARQR